MKKKSDEKGKPSTSKIISNEPIKIYDCEIITNSGEKIILKSTKQNVIVYCNSDYNTHPAWNKTKKAAARNLQSESAKGLF